MVAVPELKNYLGKEIRIELNGNRTIQGKLGGFDFFLNLTVNECVEIKSPKTKPEYITLDYLRRHRRNNESCLRE
ncbi:uncharacterized protein C5L36_0B05890 [Pichia kudriavzevii]|uniref:Sm protein G n=1 Tax=Pichia kudriavzevii TaxID=4909 RepID=A0A2U9R224_PICKU|nr:uncharacterized protein C5L36_0B05890 [Pichia kudriavzevii]AWU75343.1 hypothetical protein C5L36_0B05890 [Pichia kudriavzevii]